MKISLGSDHAGFNLKENLKEYLIANGHDVNDCGAFSAERSDYPDYAKPVAAAVSKGESDMGVLVCGSGIGMCMAANRFSGVRAAVLRDDEDAKLSRQHNDANVACIGERITDPKTAQRLLGLFLSTPFEGGRHEGRVSKIDS